MQKHLCSHICSLLPRVFPVVILIFSLTFGVHAFASQKSEHDKIDYLLNRIEISDLVFIRNGVEYTGREARAHLEEKTDFFGNRIRTAEDFINDIASESSITGISYYVRSKDGTQIEASIWLRSQLAEMK